MNNTICISWLQGSKSYNKCPKAHKIQMLLIQHEQILGSALQYSEIKTLYPCKIIFSAGFIIQEHTKQ